ncbi:HAD family hydrolase [Actinopolyspora erythraea]|uniref:HAD family hydrolase n=1 Tax=Actinopolyspora erythraea TaxID=414996 RepID=A0A099D6P8_9ACTN|nr:HAD family hydrolase [Actinopolyspora erythraea]ASU78085.1 HAD family hydrolase [Actinopolyspora erythraea]KGI81709.1 HAD family hydrolase [Actinopolyspora erythraea]
MKSALEVSAPERPSGVKAVCLDIDDTLLDSHRSARRAFASLTGNDAAWPVWRRLTDEYNARMAAGEIDFETMCRERTRDFFGAFGEQLSEGEVLAREQRRMAALRESWELFDDVSRCLEWLRASGFGIAAITNAPGAYQRHKLATTGLAASFDAVLISGECGVAKPSPGIFSAACAALCLSPAEVVHVGNNLEIDANGAACAGMHGVWLDRERNSSTSAVVPPGGVSVITSLHELPELLVCDLPLDGTGDALPARDASMVGSG